MRKHSLLGILLFVALGLSAGPRDYTKYVNLFVGTAGHGHTHPGAIVPGGMIQPGPDTRQHDCDASSGYYYEDQTNNRNTHTHQSGKG